MENKTLINKTFVVYLHDGHFEAKQSQKHKNQQNPSRKLKTKNYDETKVGFSLLNKATFCTARCYKTCEGLLR